MVLTRDTPKASGDELANLVSEVRSQFANVGLAVGVVAGEEVLLLRGFGARAAQAQPLVGPHTLFQVGSLSKSLTAGVIARLVDQGALRWDTRITELLPQFRLRDPHVTRSATLRDALAHRTGVADSLYPELRAGDDRDSLDELGVCEHSGSFRNSFLYSNLMYGVVGHAIQSATATPWGQALSEQIFSPLGMSRSLSGLGQIWSREHQTGSFLGRAPAGTPELSAALIDDVAMPHAYGSDGTLTTIPWQSYDAAPAAGRVVSSAHDLIRWMSMHLCDGTGLGLSLLTRATLAELHSPQNGHGQESSGPLGTEHYALGWRRGSYRGYVHLSHGGGIIGFPAYLAMIPEFRLGIVVLSNGPKSRTVTFGDWGVDYWLHTAVALSLFDRLLGLPPADWARRYAQQFVEHNARAAAGDAEFLRQKRDHPVPARLAGVYVDDDGRSGNVLVQSIQGRGVLSFPGTGGFEASLVSLGSDDFVIRCVPGVADIMGRAIAHFRNDGRGGTRRLSFLGRTLRRI